MIKKQKAIILIFVFSFISFIIGVFLDKNFIISPEIVIPVQSPGGIDDQFDVSLFKKVWTTVEKNYVKQPVSGKDLFYGSFQGRIYFMGL